MTTQGFIILATLLLLLEVDYQIHACEVFFGALTGIWRSPRSGMIRLNDYLTKIDLSVVLGIMQLCTPP
jgi:hypothetical protein